MTVRLAIAPYCLKDTRSLHLLLGDVSASCAHIGSIWDSPLSLLAHVAKSSVGVPQPPGLGDEGRPLLQPGRREAVGSWVGAFSAVSEARLAALGISLCPSETLPASLHCNPIPDDPVGSIIRWGEKSAQPRRHLEAPPAPGTEAEDRSRSSGRQDYYGSDPSLPQAPLAVLFPPSASGCAAIAAATAATATATGGSVPAAAASPPCFKGSAA